MHQQALEEAELERARLKAIQDAEEAEREKERKAKAKAMQISIPKAIPRYARFVSCGYHLSAFLVSLLRF